MKKVLSTKAKSSMTYDPPNIERKDESCTAKVKIGISARVSPKMPITADHHFLS